MSSIAGLGCREASPLGAKGVEAARPSPCFGAPLRLPDRGLESVRPGPPSVPLPLPPRPRPRPREPPRGPEAPLIPPARVSLRLQDDPSAAFVFSFDMYKVVRCPVSVCKKICGKFGCVNSKTTLFLIVVIGRCFRLSGDLLTIKMNGMKQESQMRADTISYC